MEEIKGEIVLRFSYTQTNLGRRRLTQLDNQLVTTAFVTQPLVLPGSATNFVESSGGPLTKDLGPQS